MSSEPMSSEQQETELALGKLAYERHVEVHEGLCEHVPDIYGMAPWEELTNTEQLRWARTAAAPWALGVSQGADDVLRRLRGRQNIVITDAMENAFYEMLPNPPTNLYQLFEAFGWNVVEDDR